MSIGILTAKWAQSQNLITHYFPSLDSTSNFAKQQLMSDGIESKRSFLVISDHQTQGRGRNTHRWENPTPGTSLLCTWAFQISKFPQPIMSPRIGLALYEAAHQTWPELPFSLKAPNDLFLDEKKVAGLLLEVVEQGPVLWFLVGLGLNVLKRPDLDTGLHLAAFLNPETLEKTWDSFLSRLQIQWEAATHQGGPFLELEECQKLLQSLNLRKTLNPPYSRVDPDGSLWNENQKTHWSEF